MMSLNTHLIKVILFLLFFFAVEGKTLFGQTEPAKELTGFRNISWGSSVKEVKSRETESYLQSFWGFGIYALSYKSKISGLSTRIDYSFKNGKLVEGSYTFEPGKNFKNDFNKLKDFLIDRYSKPNFKVGPLIESDSVWIMVTKYGKYRGPELYWRFSNGFVALIASRFEDKITLTILYTNESIKNYNKDREISVESFF